MPEDTNTTATAPDDAPLATPIGTPPGGGCWTWDAQAGAWVALTTPTTE